MSQDTIRRRIRAGLLVAHKRPRPQGFSWFVEVPEDAGTPAQPSAEPSDPQALRDQLSRLREAFRLAHEELVARRQEVQELRRELENAYDRLYELTAFGENVTSAPSEDRDAPSSTPPGSAGSRRLRVAG